MLFLLSFNVFLPFFFLNWGLGTDEIKGACLTSEMETLENTGETLLLVAAVL